MLSIIYYFIIFGSLFLYLMAIKVFKLKLITFSSVSYFMAFITAMLPGYNISNGVFYNNRFSRGFDLDIYLLYLAFSVLFPLSIILGNIAGKNIFFYSEPRNKTNARMKVTFLIILIYSVLYFLWVPQIPLNNLITGSVGIYELALQRISITHQLGALNEGMPFLFRYWRNIMQNLLFIVFIYFMISNYTVRKHSRVFIISILLFLIYNLTFTLEKASVIYLIMAVFFVSSMQDKGLNVKKMVVSVASIILLSMFLIYLFMGGKNIGDLFEALIGRLTEQTCSTYIQIEYVRQNGFLMMRGIYMPFINIIDPQYYIDMSKLAYEVIFPGNAGTNMTGSAAGMSLADLYFISSWFSLPLFIAIMFVYGFIDSICINSIYSRNLSPAIRKINMAFYVYFMSMFSLALTGSVFSILSFPFIFSPVIVILIFFYFMYAKITTISVCKSRYLGVVE